MVCHVLSTEVELWVIVLREIMGQNLVEICCHEWSDAHQGETVCMSNRSTSASVSEGPQSFSARGLINNCQQSCRYTPGCVLIAVNIVSCGQGKAKFLKQEQRTWRAECENFGSLPLKCQWIRLSTSLSNKYCDTNICGLLQRLHIKYQLKYQ